MTAPIAGSVDPSVITAVRRMTDAAFSRDEAINRVLQIRRGELHELYPEAFSDKIPRSIVANFIDVAARDLAANLAPLPALACSAGNMHTDADKRRAERKNRIGANYWRESQLEKQMKYGADQYLSYGFLPIWVEADYDRQMPIMHVEDPNGAYYELDRWFNTKRYARVWRQSTAELASLFPEYAHRILKDANGWDYRTTDTEVVRYIDDTNCLLYLPERNSMVVASYAHGQKRCPVRIGLRPGLELQPRGQYDDVAFVQLAHAMMASLTLEAGHKAVQAPLAVPSDMTEISLGPDAVIVTDQPDKVQRVKLDVPQAAFALTAQLTDEMHTGAGYPDTRLGQGPAGGSTGRGISALEGGFDQQIKLAQDIIGELIRMSTEDCFEMDATLWPTKSKKISGTLSGESFEMTYIAGKELAGDTRCDVSYGFASGTSPNAAIVTLLQLRGDDIIGRDTFRRNLPFSFDIDQQQRELDVQHVEDALKQGLEAALTATGQMIAQGQAPAAMQFFTAAAAVIEGRRQGRDLAELIVEAFQPPPAPPDQAGAPGAPGAPPGAAGAVGPDGEPLAGVGANGLPSGVAQGQAGLPPGGRPSLQDLTAGFTAGGAPAVGASIRRRIATG